MQVLWIYYLDHRLRRCKLAMLSFDLHLYHFVALGQHHSGINPSLPFHCFHQWFQHIFPSWWSRLPSDTLAFPSASRHQEAHVYRLKNCVDGGWQHKSNFLANSTMVVYKGAFSVESFLEQLIFWVSFVDISGFTFFDPWLTSKLAMTLRGRAKVDDESSPSETAKKSQSHLGDMTMPN